MTKIALEEGLTPVQEILENKGYLVLPIDTEEDVSAVVVTGGDDNLMNVANTITEGPVIEATALDPEDIVEEIEAKINL